MMQRLRDLPIRRQLIAISMLTSAAALTIASVTFILLGQVQARDDMLREGLETATLLGYKNSAVLSFGDREATREPLETLSHQSSIVAAVLYDKNGLPFSTYRNAITAPDFVAPRVEHNTHRFGRDGLELFQDIELNGEPLGTVYIRQYLSEFPALQWRNVGVVAAVMLLALVVNWLLSSRLFRRTLGPIAHLLGVARVIAAERNYGIRAVKQHNDELGELIDAFNSMLEQIQAQDSALKEAHNNLERRVDARTYELAESLSLLNATLNSTHDGILAVRLSGEFVCYNTQYTVMWGFPGRVIDKSWNHRRTLEFIAAQVQDPQAFMERMAYLQANRGLPAYDIIELRDGRTYERHIKPTRIGDDLVGVVINYRDISQRKHAEREADNVNQQLVAASRQAGMAEVATSVLHNVGNVLNSVNVSANLVIAYVKDSRVATLARVGTLVHEHADDLAHFLTEDPKGRQLPAFLMQVIEHLQSEQHLIATELQSLHDNIDHISEIVSMQQSHAKVSGVREIVNMGTLIEDTLRINDGGMQRHGVKIERDFESVPPVIIEKHKVLQIVINLLRNAKNACSESGRQDKCVTVRIAHGGDRIIVTVSDNGVGIAAENLTRMFSHGFTTRKDGHGFGLHSSALAAREFGGSLRASSEGIGRGATFTLEIPLVQAESAVA
jgi:PAS domain S-box-containing protein